MKKNLFKILGMSLILAFGAFSTNCSSDKDGDKDGNSLSKDYFTIDGAALKKGAMPAPTSDISISGISCNTQLLAGGMNFITIDSPQAYSKFFVGVKGLEEYYEVPAIPRGRDDNSYVIELMYSTNISTTRNVEMTVEGLTPDGDVTRTTTLIVKPVDSQSGDLAINLTFSNEKDVDLHLYMPDGTHIYYGNPNGSHEEPGEEQDYYAMDYYADDYEYDFQMGLDHDSNAACSIDGLNNENIVIPKEYVQNGEYTVVVDMYANCDRNTPTDWTVVARYKGQVITPISGSNPASGTYPVGAPDNDMTQVMKFKITGASGGRSSVEIPRRPLSDSAKMKLNWISME